MKVQAPRRIIVIALPDEKSRTGNALATSLTSVCQSSSAQFSGNGSKLNITA